MTNRFLYIFVLILTMAFLSCNVKKFIPEDELLYDGAAITITSDTVINNKDKLKIDLKEALRPKPNSKFLGMRPGLYFHYKAQRENPGFLNRFLNKKLGEEPVYLSDVDTYEVEQILRNRLENRGFFYSSVVSETIEDSTALEASVHYGVDVLNPYILETYQLDSDSLLVHSEIQKSMDETYFKEGKRFDLATMKGERDRIDTHLKNRGYYNFNSNFLLFESDTNQYEDKRFDLYLRLKKDVPVKSIIPYRISRVNVYPNYSVEQDSLVQDTIRYEQKNYLQEEEFFKPKRLDPYILIEEGQLYSPITSRNTSRRLGSIGVYKFVNIRYDELDTEATDSLGLLEANIFLSPLNKRALRAEVQAVTKSNGFTGPSLALTFTNRNLFKGGEILNLSTNVGYEVQTGGDSQAGRNSVSLGARADLIIPRMLFPFKIDTDFFEYAIPKTKISLGADYLSRSELFSLFSVLGTFGYTWRANRFVTHEITPISTNYVNLSNTTPEFDLILEENPFLQSSFEQQFISGLTYSFYYNGMVDATKRHQFYFNFNLGTSGNSIDLFSSGDQRPYEFLGLEYAQYVKADIDLHYHLNLGNEKKIATRLFAGYGKPYGNSEILPYTKQFFSGGPYSVRAFNTRSLGPGIYSPEEGDESAFFDRTGNIRLEANVEYRFPIVNVLKGAVFADAGNIWNSEENVALPGGRFTGEFMNQLGIGGGVGLRVDIQNFVIRLDVATPWHDPEKPEGERWEFDLDPVFNFAIGYPF